MKGTSTVRLERGLSEFSAWHTGTEEALTITHARNGAQRFSYFTSRNNKGTRMKGNLRSWGIEER